MEQLKDLAIVLRSVQFEERHRIITALTEQHGKISALARNSIGSRRFGGALEAFAAAEWRFVERTGGDLFRVEEASIRRSYEGIRENFQRLALASVFNELMIRVAPEREPCRELFRMHANALAALDELPAGDTDDSTHLPLLNGYLAKLLQWCGNQPQLQSCLACGLPLENLELHLGISCVVADAGWVCPECRTRKTQHVRERDGQSFTHSMLRATPAALLDFQMSLSTPIKQIPAQIQASRREHQDLFKFLDALIVYHLPGFDKTPLKSLRFLNVEA